MNWNLFRRKETHIPSRVLYQVGNRYMEGEWNLPIGTSFLIKACEIGEMVGFEELELYGITKDFQTLMPIPRKRDHSGETQTTLDVTPMSTAIYTEDGRVFVNSRVFDNPNKEARDRYLSEGVLKGLQTAKERFN